MRDLILAAKKTLSMDTAQVLSIETAMHESI